MLKIPSSVKPSVASEITTIKAPAATPAVAAPTSTLPVASAPNQMFGDREVVVAPAATGRSFILASHNTGTIRLAQLLCGRHTRSEDFAIDVICAQFPAPVAGKREACRHYIGAYVLPYAEEVKNGNFKRKHDFRIMEIRVTQNEAGIRREYRWLFPDHSQCQAWAPLDLRCLKLQTTPEQRAAIGEFCVLDYQAREADVRRPMPKPRLSRKEQEQNMTGLGKIGHFVTGLAQKVFGGTPTPAAPAPLAPVIANKPVVAKAPKAPPAPKPEKPAVPAGLLNRQRTPEEVAAEQAKFAKAEMAKELQAQIMGNQVSPSETLHHFEPQVPEVTPDTAAVVA